MRCEQALAGTGVDLDWYTVRERGLDEVLPWDHLDAGLDKDWLWQDWEDALDETEVEDCRWTPCFDCGVCPDLGTEIQVGPTRPAAAAAHPGISTALEFVGPARALVRAPPTKSSGVASSGLVGWNHATRSRPSADLVGLVGEPLPRVADKARSALHELDREWLAASPFCLIGTADADGHCDVSPKGDPPGQLAYVIDDRTIAIAERPGNRRVDGYQQRAGQPARRPALPHPRSRRHAADQRPGPAGLRRALLRA